MELEPNRRRVTAPGHAAPEELPTISGDRGLDHEEKLIFEIGRDGVTGVDLPVIFPMPVGGEWGYERTIAAFVEEALL